MSEVSIAIQFHPSRAHVVGRLQERLPDAQLVADPTPDVVPLVSPWRTYQHCLDTTPRSATHRLIVQDDLLAARGLAEVLPRIVERHPDALVSLYQGNVPNANAIAVTRAYEAGQRYAVIRPNGSWCPAMALIWPTALREDFQDWCLTQRRLQTGDDTNIGRWRNERLHDLVVCVPNLVEHPDDQPSLMGSRAAPHRHSCCWPGDWDATSVDW